MYFVLNLLCFPVVTELWKWHEMMVEAGSVQLWALQGVVCLSLCVRCLPAVVQQYPVPPGDTWHDLSIWVLSAVAGGDRVTHDMTWRMRLIIMHDDASQLVLTTAICQSDHKAFTSQITNRERTFRHEVTIHVVNTNSSQIAFNPDSVAINVRRNHC